jgi:hypothetical protein
VEADACDACRVVLSGRRIPAIYAVCNESQVSNVVVEPVTIYVIYLHAARYSSMDKLPDKAMRSMNDQIKPDNPIVGASLAWL